MLDYLLTTYAIEIRWMSYYALCGVLFNLMYDLIVSGIIKDEFFRFTNLQRFGVMLVWPIFLTLFLINFFISLFGNDKQ